MTVNRFIIVFLSLTLIGCFGGGGSSDSVTKSTSVLDSRTTPTAANHSNPQVITALGDEVLNINGQQAWHLHYEAAHRGFHTPGIDLFKAMFSDSDPTLLAHGVWAVRDESKQRTFFNNRTHGDNLYEFGLYDVNNIGYGITYHDPSEQEEDPTGRGLKYEKPDRVYMDYVHDVKMPFVEAEVEDVDYSNALTIGFDVISNFLTENYKNNENTYSRSERTLPNLYRDYREGNSLNNSCDPISDRYCLYTSFILD